MTEKDTPLHTSWSVGQRRVASSYFLQASSSKASLEGEVESGLTLSALSCTPGRIDWEIYTIILWSKGNIFLAQSSSISMIIDRVQLH